MQHSCHQQQQHYRQAAEPTVRNNQVMTDRHSGSGGQLAAALGHVLLRMATMATGTPRLCCFQSVKLPEVGICSYATRLQRFFRCSSECHVLALVYIDRILKRQPEITVTDLTCHRLLATSVVLATKFLDDRYYSNAYYAKVGGLSLKELNALEKRFLQMLDWRLLVRPEEYTLYHDLLCTVVARRLNRDRRPSR